MTASSEAGAVDLDVTTDAGVSVVAALADTGRTAERTRRLQQDRPFRTLRRCTGAEWTLAMILVVCTRAPKDICIVLLKNTFQRC